MPKVMFGYFDNVQKAVSALRELRLDSAKGIYLTINPVDPDLLARCNNRFGDSQDGGATGDKNILSRRWLLIDCDSERPAGVSANDDEKEVSNQRVLAIQAHLNEMGWADPILADSGNGFHLLYRVDLSAESDLAKQCLEALHQMFSDDKVKVDTSVHNPARILKLYGTLAAKGDHCPELGRPHRLSRIIEKPEEIEVVPIELLEKLARQFKPTEQKQPVPALKHHRNGIGGGWGKEQVQAFINEHLNECQPSEAQIYEDGFKWILGVCPFHPEHHNRSAVITLRSGIPGFKCHHNSCQGNDWKGLREKLGFQSQPLNTPETDGSLIEQYSSPITFNHKGEPTDINQMFVAAKFAQENLILHEPDYRMFYAYDEITGLWKPKTESKLITEIGALLRHILQQYGAESLLKKRTENLIKQVLGFLRGIVERADAFEKNQQYIHVGNGVLHFDDSFHTLHTFNPDYLSRNRSEITFDPNAACPRFINELLLPALPEEDICLLQRVAGQCLLGLNLAQIILLLRGTAGGGKSTLANVLEDVIGSHNVMQLRIEHLSDRFEMASYVGKTLLCGKDVPGDFLNQKSAYVLKALVGGDRLNAEQKNVKHRFEIIGRFNVIITSNSRLHLRLDSDAGAWRRRLVIIDYEKPSTSKPIPNFAQELVRTEGAGILNWCITGAIKLLQELNDLGKIQLTPIQQKRVDDLLCESDSVRQFVTDMVIKSEGNNVTVHELATAYHNFCDEKGWQPMSIRSFENQITNVMMETHRVAKRTDIKRNDKNQRGFFHVCLINQESWRSD